MAQFLKFKSLCKCLFLQEFRQTRRALSLLPLEVRVAPQHGSRQLPRLPLGALSSSPPSASSYMDSTRPAPAHLLSAAALLLPWLTPTPSWPPRVRQPPVRGRVYHHQPQCLHLGLLQPQPNRSRGPSPDPHSAITSHRPCHSFKPGAKGVQTLR